MATPRTTPVKKTAKKTAASPTKAVTSPKKKTTLTTTKPKGLVFKKPTRPTTLTVLNACKDIENLLEKLHGAQGRGIRDKVESVIHKLPTSIQYPIRMISAMRNKAAHESSFKPSADLPPDFFETAEEVKHFLLTGKLEKAVAG